MKVTFISVYESIISYGMRCLSSVLKKDGVETQMIFLPHQTECFRWQEFDHHYPPEILNQIADLSSDSDLIGLTVMSSYHNAAVQITQHLHNACSAPIIWGGIHPTVCPELCLEHADIICINEGEDALLELTQKLANGQGHTGINNIWYKQNDEIVRTPLQPLLFNLDHYPYPDYDLDNEFVLHQGRIQRTTRDLLLYHLQWPSYTGKPVSTYHTMMSRGCDYHCAYCCHDALNGLYDTRWSIRRRSVPNFLGELKQIMTRFPEFKCIVIEDDVFISDPEQLRQFRDGYKQITNTPLCIGGFQPPMINEEAVKLLVEAGTRWIRVGLQTGSMSVMHKIYRRPVKRKHLENAVSVLHKFKGCIEPPIYDILLDNPWETEEDHLEMLYMLLDMPKPYHLNLFSLTFYPGTLLYKRAKKEGLLHDEEKQVYRKQFVEYECTYINGLYKLFQVQYVPRWAMSLLLSSTMRNLKPISLLDRIDRFFLKIYMGKAMSKAFWRKRVIGLFSNLKKPNKQSEGFENKAIKISELS